MVLGGVERLEHTAVLLWTDAVSPILHAHVDNSSLGPSRRDEDKPLGRRGRGHGIHRVHDEIQQDLLQLHRIAPRQKRAVFQIKPDVDIAADQLAVQQADG